MFEFLEPRIDRTFNGALQGTITKNPSWLSAYGRHPFSMVGTLALRTESVGALIDYLDATKNVSAHANESNSSRYGFQGFETFAQACDVFKNRPWEVRTFSPNDIPLRFAENVGNQVEYDVVGDYIDMGRFLEGEPECWGHNTMGNPQGLFATIMVNVSAKHTVSADTITYRGERVTRLVDWLENQHIRTEVVAILVSECAYVETVVKQFDTPLNLDTIAVVGHSDFFRRLLFRVIEMSPTWRSNYGVVHTVSKGDFTLPKQAQGLMLISELASASGYDVTTLDVQQKFDAAELAIERALEEGDTSLSLVM